MGKLYCIPRLDELESYIDFSDRYNAGFEYNEFFIPKILDDDVSKERIMAKYLSCGRNVSEDTLHGAFFDIVVNSDDKRIFDVSSLRVHQCMDIARDMGIKAVVFHTNYIVNFRLQSYIDSWLERNEKFWREILKEYPEQMVYIENMFDDAPGMLLNLYERMSDEPRFKVCLDVAHAFISGRPVENWYTAFKNKVGHLHINDNDADQDLHLPVGSGKFDWSDFDRWCKSSEIEPSVLIEVRGFNDLSESAAFMMAEHIYPFN